MLVSCQSLIILDRSSRWKRSMEIQKSTALSLLTMLNLLKRHPAQFNRKKLCHKNIQPLPLLQSHPLNHQIVRQSMSINGIFVIVFYFVAAVINCGFGTGDRLCNWRVVSSDAQAQFDWTPTNGQHLSSSGTVSSSLA